MMDISGAVPTATGIRIPTAKLLIEAWDTYDACFQTGTKQAGGPHAVTMRKSVLGCVVQRISLPM